MQGCPSIALFAHGADDNEVPLAIIADNILTRRVSQLVVGAHLLPLADAPRTKAVLALATLFCIEYHHLTDSTDEVLVECFR